MKPKIWTVLVIVALSFSQRQFAFSQCIHVELSITWDTGHDIFEKDSIVCIPSLHITYRNNSDINYYFLKVSDSRAGLPVLHWGSLLQYPIEEYLHPNYRERAKWAINNKYAKEEYYACIGGDPVYRKGWSLEDFYKPDIKEDEDGEIDMINDNIANIYEYIYREYHKENADPIKEAKTYFAPSNLAPEKILSTVKDRFVFLKPGETYVDTYNLIGFKLAKGRFIFYINQKDFKDYVYTGYWDENQSKWLNPKAALPVEVGEYKLYSGEFSSNKITVTF